MRALHFAPLVFAVAACSDTGPGGVDRSADRRAPDLARPDATPRDWPRVPEAWMDGRVPFATCSLPKPLVLLGTPPRAVTSGVTSGLDDLALGPIDCGGDLSAPMSGPQMYFRVALEAGKSYKAVLAPTFDGGLYAFPATTPCETAAVNAACKSEGGGAGNTYSSDRLGQKVIEVVRVAPATTGDWIIAVDSWRTGESGAFTLTVVESAVSPNGTCASSKPLAFAAGQAQESGDLDTLADDPPGVSCGTTTSFAGPQLYFLGDVPKNAPALVISIGALFPAYVYLFPASVGCQPAQIEAACGSQGVSGAVFGPTPSYDATKPTPTYIFQPKTPGSYVLVVDSAAPPKAPLFDLTVKQVVPPPHQSCVKAQPVALTASPTSVSADTTAALNEFGQAITCGTGLTYDGGQVYYRLSLEAGKVYTINVAPAGWDVALLAFEDTTCDPTKINAQCGTWIADAATAGGTETLTIAPAVATDVIVAVDSYSPFERGAFNLTVAWK